MGELALSVASGCGFDLGDFQVSPSVLDPESHAYCLLELPWDCQDSCLTLEDVDGSTVMRFVNHAYNAGNIGFDYEGNHDALARLGLIRAGGLTNAGALLFCNPGRILLTCERIKDGTKGRTEEDAFLQTHAPSAARRFGMALGCPLADAPCQALIFIQSTFGAFVDIWTRMRPEVLIRDGSGNQGSFRSQMVPLGASWSGLPIKVQSRAVCSDVFSALVQVFSQLDFGQSAPVRLVATAREVVIECDQRIWGLGGHVGQSRRTSPLVYRNPLIAETLMLLDGAKVGIRAA